ncbi:MAG: type II secretion system F family protein [Lachnospiraceae bacterium]|nr:type II secretion system F family protein [Lachnospiraceae bacterium]
MPEYRFKSQDEAGKQQSGRMNAIDEADLQKKLRNNGQMLLSASPVTKKITLKPLKKSELANFCTELGTMTQAGVPLVRLLEILANNESITPYEKYLFIELRDKVVQGVALSSTMESLYPAFPPLLIYMFRASESSGNMDVTALNLADQYTRENQLEENTKSALVYPKILIALIIGVVLVIFGYVMPQFEELFAQMESLPVATRVLMWISNFVSGYWYLILIVGGLAIFFGRIILRIPSIKLVVDTLKTKGPIGKLNNTIYSARFARTLSSLYSAGIPVDRCVTIASQTIGNKYVESQFEKVLRDIQAGVSLSDAIDKVEGFIAKLPSVIRIGEETGMLDKMLTSIANDLDFKAAQAMTRLVKYIEPITIVVMAIIVGFVMIGVITPIYQSYSYIGAG